MTVDSRTDVFGVYGREIQKITDNIPYKEQFFINLQKRFLLNYIYIYASYFRYLQKKLIIVNFQHIFKIITEDVK